MTIRQIDSDQDLGRYDRWVKQPGIGNLWQSLERKQYLEALGKEVRIYALMEGDPTPSNELRGAGTIAASALVVIDRTKGGYSTWDIPRGPIGRGKTDLLDRIIADAKDDRCLAVYFSPVQLIDRGKPSSRHIHCEATRLIDLAASEDEILSQMKQKGRYNIKVAQKHDVTIKQSDDIDAWFDLVQKTGKRDGFVPLPKEQYRVFLDHLPGSFLLLAYDNQAEPIAGVLSVVWGKRGIYYYGASNYAERAKMAPYLLQWESMRRCKAQGCTEYDLLGIAPEKMTNEQWPMNSIQSIFSRWSLNIGHSPHPWSGISSFKEKFGGEIVVYPEERMVALKPSMHYFLQMKRRLLG